MAMTVLIASKPVKATRASACGICAFFNMSGSLPSPWSTRATKMAAGLIA